MVKTIKRLVDVGFIMSIAYFLYYGVLSITGVHELALLIALYLSASIAFDSNIGKSNQKER